MTTGAGPIGGLTLRRWLLLLGILLTIVSAGYLAAYAYKHWRQLPPLEWSPATVSWLLAAAVLYFSSLITTAMAWLCAIRTLGASTPLRAALGVALASQIGKYAPGNVAHHIGRAALAGNRGLPLGMVAKASLMEIATAVAASVFLAGGLLLLFPQSLGLLGGAGIDALDGRMWLAFAVAGAVAGAIGLAAWLRRARRELAWGAGLASGLGRMLVCYGFSFLFAGVSYYAAARAFGQSPPLMPCVAIYALAWVAGFITPGAPAGLGVRETILVAALTGSLGPAAISVAIAHRLITALADAAAAGVGAVALSNAGSAGRSGEAG